MQAIHAVSDLLWGPGMMVFFLGSGLWLTVRLRGVQFRYGRRFLRTVLKGLFHPGEEMEEGISPRRAASLALAGTLGVGNIAGVATALTLGGPGAIFWMWASATLSLAVSFAENVAGHLYRERGAGGQWRGGPMQYMRKGLNAPAMAGLYALLCVLTSLGMGNVVQAHTAVDALSGALPVHPAVLSGGLAIVVAVAVPGGARRISGVTARVIPALSILFVLGALGGILRNIGNLHSALWQILSGAFAPASALGGAAGYGMAQAVRYGVARGVFSNEAGLGTLVLAHADSQTREPAEQGMWGAFEVFVDTLLMCTLTALLILTTGAMETGLTGAPLCAQAFYRVFGRMGEGFSVVATALFALATLLSWCYFGEVALRDLTQREWARRLYRSLFVGAVLVGGLMRLDTVWALSEISNALMALINLPAVLLLSGQVREAFEGYLKTNLSFGGGAKKPPRPTGPEREGQGADRDSLGPRLSRSIK